MPTPCHFLVVFSNHHGATNEKKRYDYAVAFVIFNLPSTTRIFQLCWLIQNPYPGASICINISYTTKQVALADFYCTAVLQCTYSLVTEVPMECGSLPHFLALVVPQKVTVADIGDLV